MAANVLTSQMKQYLSVENTLEHISGRLGTIWDVPKIVVQKLKISKSWLTGGGVGSDLTPPQP